MKQGVTRRLPTQPGRFDTIVIGATAFAILGWITGPDGAVMGGVLMAAAFPPKRPMS